MIFLIIVFIFSNLYSCQTGGDTISPTNQSSPTDTLTTTSMTIDSNNDCLKSPLTRLCVNEKEFNFNSNTKIFFPSSLLPSDLVWKNREMIQIFNDETSLLNNRSPCDDLSSTNSLIASVTLSQDPIKVNSYISYFLVDFTLSQSDASILLNNLQNQARQNQIFLRLMDPDQRQCILGPNINGDFATSTPINITRLNEIIVTPTPISTLSPSQTSVASTTTPTISQTPSQPQDSSTNPLLRIVIILLIGSFVIISTILAFCLWKKRDGKESDHEKGLPKDQRGKGGRESVYSSDEIATRIPTHTSFRLPSLSSIHREHESPFYTDREDLSIMESFLSNSSVELQPSANLETSLRSSSLIHPMNSIYSSKNNSFTKTSRFSGNSSEIERISETTLQWLEEDLGSLPKNQVDTSTHDDVAIT